MPSFSLVIYRTSEMNRADSWENIYRKLTESSADSENEIPEPQADVQPIVDATTVTDPGSLVFRTYFMYIAFF